MFVTLEPCCHEGKTPACSKAVIAAGLKRVVVAVSDPAEHVNGGGLNELQAAGITVETGLLAEEASLLAAPFFKLMNHRQAVRSCQVGDEPGRKKSPLAPDIRNGSRTKSRARKFTNCAGGWTAFLSVP